MPKDCEWCGRECAVKADEKVQEEISGVLVSVECKTIDLSHVRENSKKDKADITYHNRWRVCNFEAVKSDKGDVKSCYETLKKSYDLTENEIEKLRRKGMTEREIALADIDLKGTVN